MDFGFFETVSGLFKPSVVTFDDDFVDRLNHHYSCLLLIFFAVLVSGKTYVGQPLQCAVPHSYNKAMEQFAETFCFVQNTYFVAPHEEIPNKVHDRDERKITYYQWIPFVLALQALLFYLPCVLWRTMNWKSGIHVSGIIQLAGQSQLMTDDGREPNMSALASHLHEGLHTQKSSKAGWTQNVLAIMSKYGLCVCGRRYGNYLGILYVFVKLLYVVNVICQFFLINAFLSSKYDPFYGFEMIHDLSSGHEWHDSGKFPRVTFCDFEIRVLANVQRHTIQCVLMINMFNEKIYVFIWFWCLLVAVLTILSFFSFIYNTFVPSKRIAFVLRYLRMNKLARTMSLHDSEDFIIKYLQTDGVIMLRLIAGSGGYVVAYAVLRKLWKKHTGRDLNGDDDKKSNSDDKKKAEHSLSLKLDV